MYGMSVFVFQGMEDYMGDMDFKIAGSRTGFTAVQVLYPIIVAAILED